VEVDPADWNNHDLVGQALENSGNLDAAIAAYREALTVAPKEVQPRLDLAAALEKKGDWLAALDNYHQAVLNQPQPKPGIPVTFFDAQHKYEAAQQRFQQHLADLRSMGKSAEAASLEEGLRNRASTTSLDEKFHDAMESSNQALSEKRFEDAETAAKRAIEIAEKIQPQDSRLSEAYGRLGSVYFWRMDLKNAEDAYKRQLTLLQTLYGPKSPMIAPALESLAMVAAYKKDFASAEAQYAQVLETNRSFYGDESTAMAESLRRLTNVYLMQQNYAKAESTLLRVISIYEKTYGSDDPRMSLAQGGLCQIYDQWGKPDKSAPCHARIVEMAEKQFGANSPYLVRELTAEARALRQLGRNEEAAKLEQRTQFIQSAQTNPN
jgi:tetratricopeptide (TPR) repeat protein